MTTLVYSQQGSALWTHFNPRRMAGNLWSNRALAAQLASREIRSRYRSHALGPAWALLYPLAMLAIFTFLFAVVFRQRWTTGGSVGEVALQIFAGLIVFQVFREMVGRAPGLVVSHANLVKRVVFPLEVLPAADLMTALFTFGVNLVVWLVGWVVIAREAPHATALLTPLFLLPVCLAGLGISWALAALGVFARDIQYLTELALTVLFFLTPVFYAADRIPEPYRVLIDLNPIAHSIGWVRGALMQGVLPGGWEWAWWGVATVVSALIAVGGYAVFMKSRRAFADVL